MKWKSLEMQTLLKFVFSKRMSCDLTENCIFVAGYACTYWEINKIS
jgi:hypothetical protein